jgi:hypothetical protein
MSPGHGSPAVRRKHGDVTHRFALKTQYPVGPFNFSGKDLPMDEHKIIAAILTLAASARENRGSSVEVGKENWRKVIKDYELILQDLKAVQVP